MFSIISIIGISQENYDSKPWSKCAENGKKTIKISTDGKMIAFPQYFYVDKIDSTTKIINSIKENIIVVDEKGNIIQPNYYYKVQQLDLKKRIERATNLNLEQKNQLDSTLKLFDKNLNAQDYLSNLKLALNTEVEAGWNQNKYSEFFPKEFNTQLFKSNNDSSFIIKINNDKKSANEFLYKYEVSVKSDLINNWFKSTHQNIKKQILEFEISNSNLITYYEANRSTLERSYTNCKENNQSELKKIVEIIKKLNEDGEQIQQKKKSIIAYWDLVWFWYSGKVGQSVGFGSTSNKIVQDSLDKVDAKIKAYESLMSVGALGEDTKNLQYPTISKEYANLVITKKEITETLKNNLENAEKLNKELNKILDDTVKLYSGLIYVSNNKESHFMRSHNFSSEYDEIGTLRKEYYEDEKIHFLVHNSSGVDKNVKLEMTGEYIEKNSPDWVDETNSIFDDLASVKGIEGIQGYVTELNKIKLLNSEKFLMPVPSYDKKDTCLINVGILKILLADYEKGLYDEKFNVFVNNIKRLETPEKNTCLSTLEMQPKSESIKLPAAISYEFNKYKTRTEKEESFTFKNAYKKYNYRYVQVYGGLNYSLTNVQTLDISVDATPLEPKLTSNPLQFVTGVKIYPWGGEIRENKFFQMTKHRIHFNAAVSMPKPLTNLFFGAGFDLYPGIDLNVNLQLMRDNRYKLENGSVTETSYFYRPALSIGTGIDASVFVKAIKFLF
jgi:hypothetical protein